MLIEIHHSENLVRREKIIFRGSKMTFRKWIKENKKNIALTVGIALVVKIAGDLSRTYGAFGGEDVLLIGAIGYWLYRWHEDKKFFKNKEY